MSELMRELSLDACIPRFSNRDLLLGYCVSSGLWGFVFSNVAQLRADGVVDLLLGTAAFFEWARFLYLYQVLVLVPIASRETVGDAGE